MLRVLLILITSVVMFWAGVFGYFLQSIPSKPTDDSATTDAIVVLTGGSLRIPYGFELLAKRKAHILYISGVDSDTDVAALTAANHVPNAVRDASQKGQKIVLDYVADSTRTNATQTAKWAKREGIITIRLVTSNYHLPRALVEFRREMPEVDIIKDPVFPENFHSETWWDDKFSRELLFSEFVKFVVVWLWPSMVT